MDADSRMVSRIYDVVAQPEQWVGVLDELADHVGAFGGNVFLGDLMLEELNCAWFSTDLQGVWPDYIREYMAIEQPLFASTQQILKNPDFIHVDQLVARHNGLGLPTVDLAPVDAWLQRDFGIHDRHISALNSRTSYFNFITLSFGDISADARLNGLQSASRLLPHLARAVELTRPFLLLKQRFNAVLQVLDRLHLGVFLLSPSGAVIVNNEAANDLLAKNDGLAVDQRGRLFGGALRQVCEAVLQEEDGGFGTCSRQLSLKRQWTASPYLLEVSPLRSDELDAGRIRGLLVIVVDPDHREIVNTEGLSLIYGLTGAEQSICELLVDGHETQEIADIRQVSLATVRNQIKSLMGKFGVSHRTDLVRQILRVNIPVDAAGDD